ncbi:MAG: hypothetical protein IKG40_01720 [Bacilli bacterium]|nr:hypothetical protein [Bacilli bacterium]
MINIKKLLLFLTITLILTGCEDKPKTIKNPNGKSLTYNYFKNINLETYTIKLKNSKRDIIYIKDKDKTYYEVSDEYETSITIQNNSGIYTLDTENKTYIKENEKKQIDYMNGYFPENTKKIKKQSYITGHERIDLFKYTYETYNYSTNTTTYYYRGKKLKLIKNKNALNETTVKVVSLSNKVDKNKFKIPKDYEKLEM